MVAASVVMVGGDDACSVKEYDLFWHREKTVLSHQESVRLPEVLVAGAKGDRDLSHQFFDLMCLS